MSLEADVVTVLQAQCPRVFPSSAPVDTERPFVTWDNLGGDSLRYMEGTNSGKRLAQLQINVWADRKLDALTLSLAIEDALCTAGAFTASPNGDVRSSFHDEADMYGTAQDFTVLGTR